MRTIFLVSLIFLGFNSFSQTDVYHPLPIGWGATYRSTHVIGGLPRDAAYTHKYEAWGGDTIINSVTYTKVYAKSSGGGIYAYSHEIRQDIPNEKVFFLDAGNMTELDISFD